MSSRNANLVRRLIFILLSLRVYQTVDPIEAAMMGRAPKVAVCKVSVFLKFKPAPVPAAK